MANNVISSRVNLGGKTVPHTVEYQLSTSAYTVSRKKHNPITLTQHNLTLS